MILHNKQIKDRLDFIDKYMQAENHASGSEVDANANVTHKTVATLEAEIYKPLTIQLNRKKVYNKLKEMYGISEAKDYLDFLGSHLIYTHDETSLKPYCASITLYPYLLHGTKCIDGSSSAPKNLQSFCGGFINLMNQIASNFAGAVATVEFLMYFDYFARKQYGTEYLNTHYKEVFQEMQGVVYSMNQPASARGDQCIFWNISVFDKPYMEEMFGAFYFPDGTQPDMKSLYELQLAFMEWFRKERQKSLLTFPVLTASLLTDEKGFADDFFMAECAYQMHKGHSFFVYMSDSVDSLASCCRLRNELADNTFSYSLGAGGVVTGSSQVITINMNRLVQIAVKNCGKESLYVYIKSTIDRVQHFLLAHKEIYKEYIDAGMLPAYSAGFMDLDKQFLTIGINGLAEGMEYLSHKVGNNPEYKAELRKILQIFTDSNKKALADTGCRFNTELVPAENLGVKNAKWDKEEGVETKRDCYNSYFYLVEDEDTTLLDKVVLYGADVTKALDGGSALHLNLGQLLSFQNALTLFNLCRQYKVPYWTTNVLTTICEDCGHIDPETRTTCRNCGSKHLSYATRIIGYLKKLSNFSLDRQKEAVKRFYH